MSTLTTNYDFILPAVNDPIDEGLWGGYLNSNFETLDALLPTFDDSSGTVPIGGGMDYWGTTAPSGWVFAYGQALNRTTYADLFTIFSTTYGAGDGSTTFNIPDKRDRASFGKGDMGGTSAGRITDQTGGWEGDTLGDSGGAETHTLSTPQIPVHTHTVIEDNNSGSANISPAVLQVGDGGGNLGTATTSSTGGGEAHNNLPPGIVCNYIIYTGVV